LPDGSIAFNKYRFATPPTVPAIWILRPDDETPKPFIADAFDMAWSSDARHRLAFVSTRTE
jgi:hypothetical protein